MKLSAKHQAAVDCLRFEQREKLAYHHILTALATGAGKWGGLQRVGSVYDSGDTYVWQVAFTPRMKEAVIMETFKSRTGQGEQVRCFYLEDVSGNYRGRSFESKDVMAKMQALYYRAEEMARAAA